MAAYALSLRKPLAARDIRLACARHKEAIMLVAAELNAWAAVSVSLNMPSIMRFSYAAGCQSAATRESPEMASLSNPKRLQLIPGQ